MGMKKEITEYEIETGKRLQRVKDSQLKSFAGCLALMSGFGSTFMAQTPIPTDKLISDWVIFSFGGVSALFVCLTVVSCLLCIFLLVVVQSYDCSTGNFRDFWNSRCEEDWTFAFQLFLWSIPIFFCDLILLGFIQFRNTPSAQWTVFAVSLFFMIVLIVVTIPRWRLANHTNT